MIDLILEWLLVNKIELLGAILGLLYIFFSIRQSILTWPTGLLTSALYIIVFFQAGFYADMGLQVYYVVISIYGWYFWISGKKKTDKKLPVRTTHSRLWLKLTGVFTIAYIIILYILLEYTDSTVPYMDTLTTALSIIATWMLARKYIEHWLIWIFVDFVSMGLYVYKKLWPTVVLFAVYTLLAGLGYAEWKNDKIKEFEKKS